MADVYTGTEPYGYVHEHGGIFKRVSWGALFAGAVISIVTMLVLTLLGMGIGFGIINPATEENPFGGVGIGAAIWLGLSALIALFFGGWATARLAGSVRGLNGVLHSIVMWGVVTIVSFFLMSTIIGSLVSGAFTVVGKSMSAIASGVASVAPQVQQELAQRGITLDSVINQAERMLGEGQGAKGAGAGGGAGNQAAVQDLRKTLQKVFESGQGVSASDKETMVNTLVNRTDMSRAEAENTVNSLIQQYQQVAQGTQQAMQQAKQITGQAMDALASASIWLFVLLVLEAAAAAFGGWLGASREEASAAGPV